MVHITCITTKKEPKFSLKSLYIRIKFSLHGQIYYHKIHTMNEFQQIFFNTIMILKETSIIRKQNKTSNDTLTNSTTQFPTLSTKYLRQKKRRYIMYLFLHFQIRIYLLTQNYIS